MVGGIAKRAVRASITKRVRNIWVKINLKWNETVVGWPRTLVNLGNARHSRTLSNTVETNSTPLAINYFKLFEKCAPIFQMKLIFQVFIFHYQKDPFVISPLYITCKKINRTIP